MASGPITSWQIHGSTVRDFILGGSKITVDGDCSHEITRHLLLWRKAMTNLVSKVSQSCLTLWDPMKSSLPGSSVHRIFQARILEWVAISFSRGSSQTRNWTGVYCIAGRFFTNWATRKAESESWTIKKAEPWRIDAFELWCWRRHLRVPWTARRANQSILKEISPEY